MANTHTIFQRALVIDDDMRVARYVSDILGDRCLEVVQRLSAGEGVSALDHKRFDVILLDLRLPDASGIQVLQQLKGRLDVPPIIVISGSGTVDDAVQAMQLGAVDFIEKPFAAERLLVTVHNALRMTRVQAENDALRAQSSTPEQTLLGSSAAMQRVRQLIRQVGPTEARVLIHGESGTGKELVARALHDVSPRADKPFVAVNCAAIPDTLIESELFGHEKGAFTGATKQRRGRFEAADGGTLFLDEIGDLPPNVQAVLLRALQEDTIQRIGAEKDLPVDVRIIAATNRNLAEMIDAGTFREDLFYRLSVVTITLPPLRQRRDDIREMAQVFAARAAVRNRREDMTIDDKALALLTTHHFRGNVRELENLVEQLVVLAEGDTVTVRDVHRSLPEARPTPIARLYEPGTTFKDRMVELARGVITETLQHHAFNVTQAAKALGFERSYLYKKCRDLDLDIQALRETWLKEQS